MIDSTDQQFLHAVFCLSRANAQIDLATVAATACLTTTQSIAAALSVTRLGLLDLRRMRLTMRGLATAVQLDEAVRAERREQIRDRARTQKRTARLQGAARAWAVRHAPN